MEDEIGAKRKGSIADPFYSEGKYFSNPRRHSEDSDFKADSFLKLFVPLAKSKKWDINSYADVGCGSGGVTELVSKGLRDAGFKLNISYGYDLSPHVTTLQSESVLYVRKDFCQTNQVVDLVSLFDVFEHVVRPIDFLRDVMERARIVVLHIPLDNTLSNAYRDKFRSMLNDPGHLIFMDSINALNLCSLAGLRVIDYRYTFGFRAPSGHRSLLSKLVFPLRLLLSWISPWLLSRTTGGASLLVVALSPLGLSALSHMNYDGEVE